MQGAIQVLGFTLPAWFLSWRLFGSSCRWCRVKFQIMRLLFCVMWITYACGKMFRFVFHIHLFPTKLIYISVCCCLYAVIMFTRMASAMQCTRGRWSLQLVPLMILWVTFISTVILRMIWYIVIRESNLSALAVSVGLQLAPGVEMLSK